MPIIERATLVRPKTGEIGEGDSLEVDLDLHYTGRCNITVLAYLAFGKQATISVTVAELVGKVRLGFHHFPHQHWSYSFVDEPEVQFEVESVFEGATVPQLSLLITNQIRRSIRKRHTLPAAIFRYNPFFSPPTERCDVNVEVGGQPLHVGLYAVNVLNARDLVGTRGGSLMYCVLSLEDIEENFANLESLPKMGANIRTLQIDIERGDGKGEIGVRFAKGSATSLVRGSSADCRIAGIDEGSLLAGTAVRPGDTVGRATAVGHAVQV